ncbi:DUF4974 domain-containing protein [Azoarcus indigens]|uniref:FecR family protein n=1 Tax=Azoarcus indigens TaxID=29545 RepID=A0A4V3BLH1_9RHOO|nr:FecR domain-containing protein [Azoarcus indigens]NMG66870.1 DUF4974 domain-containing protein [Azoarcus indigens]TDN46702.1 FecR family protein [Azoarcus indigens]
MGQDASEKRIEHALTLIARAAIEAPDAASKAREQLARWRAGDEENEAAWAEAMRRWEMLGAMAADLRQRFDEPAYGSSADARRVRRRMLLSLGALCMGTAMLGGGGAWYAYQPVFVQSYRTVTAQLLQAELPDGQGLAGSQIDLNARSALTARLYRGRRVVALEEGEAHFQVAPDASRPFLVETRVGTVEVVGTAFTVSDRGGPVSISVEHGHVRFFPKEEGLNLLPWNRRMVELYGGDGVVLRDGQVEPVRRVDASALAAWRDGWLVFDNVRLDEVVPAVNAYRDAPILLADARVSAFRLTGRFRAANSRELLDVLPAMFPLKIERRDGGTISLSSR